MLQDFPKASNTCNYSDSTSSNHHKYDNDVLQMKLSDDDCNTATTSATGGAIADTTTSSSTSRSSTPVTSNETATPAMTMKERVQDIIWNQVLLSNKFWNVYYDMNHMNHQEQWVITPSGSFMNAFNWVPQHLRMGPWNPVSMIYLTIVLYITSITGAYIISDNDTEFSFLAIVQDLEYPPLFSIMWCYNLSVAMYMMYIMYLIVYKSPAGVGAWITYTVQSWTLLCLRHLLCCLAPISVTAQLWVEYIRFPVAVSTTITFGVWNCLIFPYAYYIAMKTVEQKHNFYTFCTSFRMLNLHVMNIVLTLIHFLYSGMPRRELYWTIDFYISLLSVVVYMIFYLGILDRLGIHLYPIFSPRGSTILVITMWTFTVGSYISVFYLWRHLLLS